MHVCMYLSTYAVAYNNKVFIWTCFIGLYLYVHMCIYTYIHRCMFTDSCSGIHAYVHVSTYVYLLTYKCSSVYMYIHMSTCIYVYTFIHTFFWQGGVVAQALTWQYPNNITFIVPGGIAEIFLLLIRNHPMSPQRGSRTYH